MSYAHIIAKSCGEEEEEGGEEEEGAGGEPEAGGGGEEEGKASIHVSNILKILRIILIHCIDLIAKYTYLIMT